MYDLILFQFCQITLAAVVVVVVVVVVVGAWVVEVAAASAALIAGLQKSKIQSHNICTQFSGFFSCCSHKILIIWSLFRV